ncbi:MAG: HEPN domain-containing protein [bacterium]
MKESADILIKKAEKDLNIAKSLPIENHDFLDGICFHCQQAVEKYLKAYLAYNNHKINYNHNIEETLSRCSTIDISFVKLQELNIDQLTDYAVTVRYDDIIEPTLDDAKEAINITEKVKSFVIEKINELSNKPNKQTKIPDTEDVFTKDLNESLNKKKGLKR